MRHTQSFQNLNQQQRSFNTSLIPPSSTDRGGQAQSQNRNPALSNNPPVTGAHVMSNEQKKVLEEIQKTKSLLKQGAAANLGLPFTSSVPVTPNNHFSNQAGSFSNDVHISPLQRTAMQLLQQTNATSFGSFVSTDSHFGNGILPVLPRIADTTTNKTDLKPAMKLKELESYLSQCEPFANPKVVLEQYATSAHIAARMIFAAQDKMQDATVCDLGSGCGILSIGSVMAGARYVLGMEMDQDAIEIALENREEVLDDSTSALEFIQTQIKCESWENDTVGHRFQGFFDVVIMNPPFGTKNNAGADYDFLKYASKLVKPSGCIYSIHKTSTRSFFEKKLKDTNNDLELSGNVLAEVKFDIPKCYKFHKEKSMDVHVDFWCFQKNCKS